MVILETANPLAVRRTVSFSEAVYEGTGKVEEVPARRVATPREALLATEELPVLVDPTLISLSVLAPSVLIDATMVKLNLGMSRHLAPGTIALGPGFDAGTDVDAVIETNRGPDLGRVLWSGAAEPNTHRPSSVHNYSSERVLRAPKTGTLRVASEIGALVSAGAEVARVGGAPVGASFPGVVRGLLRDGTEVSQGQKIGDIDPRQDPSLVQRVSDKSLAVAGGALEATLILLNRPETRTAAG